MPRTLGRFLGLAGAGVCAGAALGQSVQVPPGAQKVEAGIGDMGAVPGVSRIDMRRDLRQNRGFGDVFRMDMQRPYAGPGGTSSMFFRIDGGIAAVFPEGTYTNDLSRGGRPEIPPGTIFYVGGLPDSMTGPPPTVRSPYAVDLSVSMRPDRPLPPVTLMPPGAGVLGGAGGGIWESEDQRQRTVGALLDRAAAGR